MATLLHRDTSDFSVLLQSPQTAKALSLHLGLLGLVLERHRLAAVRYWQEPTQPKPWAAYPSSKH